MRQIRKRDVSKSSLSGKLIPWQLDIDQPHLVRIEDRNFLAVFSTEEKAKEAIRLMGVKAKIKVITDGEEFYNSVVSQIDIILDPYITPQGTTRFTLLFPKGYRSIDDPWV